MKNIKRLKKVEKRLKNQNQKGLKLQLGDPLTSKQKEVYDYITKDYLTPTKIANIKGTSVQAVYKTLDIIKKKGYSIYKRKKVEKNVCTLPSKNNLFRLHGQEFSINLLKTSEKYNKTKEKGNLIFLDNNTIRLYNNSIEVYSGKDFVSDDINKATADSFNYFNKLFTKLESQLGVLILKDRYQNIKLVKNHYAEINNELAEEVIKEGKRIRVYTTENNKLWFELDNSFNLKEAETVHTETAKRDMEHVVKPFFNDLRDKEHLLPSEVKEAILQTQNQIHEIANGLNALLKLQTPKEMKGGNDLPPPDYFG